MNTCSKPYRVLKAEQHDLPSLVGYLTDGTLDYIDRDKDMPQHLLYPSHPALPARRLKPIWRLSNIPDESQNSTSSNANTSSSNSGSNNNSSGAGHQPQLPGVTNSIKPSEMMHVAINYGGLPGYSYVTSLDEFVSEVDDPLVHEVAARKCDLLSDRVYSISQLFKDSARRRHHHHQALRAAGEVELAECLAEDGDNVLDSNDRIIRLLEQCDVGEEMRLLLLQKLHSQLSQLTRK